MLFVFRVLIVIGLFLLFTPAFSAIKDYGNKAASVVSVTDGDTITVNIADWPDIIGSKIPVRLYGIDTPEIHGACQYEKDKALEAKEFVKSLAANKQVDLIGIKRESMYFRLLADVMVDGKSLSTELIAAGLARPYFGKTKSSWCP